MKKRFLCSVTIALMLSGCGIGQPKEPDFPRYTGEPLNIAYIGKTPEVREDNVRLEEISFTELKNRKRIASTFDAVLIMPNKLLEADQGQYASLYRKMRIPMFFIGSNKGHVPFIADWISYKEAAGETTDYAAGYLNGKTTLFWTYGLYNDVKTKGHITAMYSNVFQTVETVKYKTQQ
ncbi:hypothetical protein QK289_15205 [Exiguobacterium antarcticum]|uniref:Lipoprotein n=1 Tax=Exiguobacterium antarcticum TaxID=132920 RepID=A0ABT6R5Y3_9BACL|nr:hypothetical protein [Exiguobacterium antarcticum]MDI3236361.1 hypothetical protein [Exiguobacterium antarcticum]